MHTLEPKFETRPKFGGDGESYLLIQKQRIVGLAGKGLARVNSYLLLPRVLVFLIGKQTSLIILFLDV